MTDPSPFRVRTSILCGIFAMAATVAWIVLLFAFFRGLHVTDKGAFFAGMTVLGGTAFGLSMTAHLLARRTGRASIVPIVGIFLFGAALGFLALASLSWFTNPYCGGLSGPCMGPLIFGELSFYPAVGALVTQGLVLARWRR